MRRGEPLYRRVNSKARGSKHGGGEYRWSRHARREDTVTRGAMGSMHHGLDYTPLFRFLLSRVGDDWTEVRREAAARLDKPEPIGWLVAEREEDRRASVRVGDSSYYSGLFVNAESRLAVVDPDLRVEELTPSCACCTHTFNGARFVRRYGEEGVRPGLAAE